MRTPGADTGRGHQARIPGTDTRRGHQARTPGADIRRGHRARTSGADTRRGHQARTPGADIGRGYQARTPGADTGRGHRARFRRRAYYNVRNAGLSAQFFRTSKTLFRTLKSLFKTLKTFFRMSKTLFQGVENSFAVQVFLRGRCKKGAVYAPATESIGGFPAGFCRALEARGNDACAESQRSFALDRRECRKYFFTFNRLGA